MGRRKPAAALTLEQQLAAVGDLPLATGPYDVGLDGDLHRRRVAWHDSRRDLQDRIRARDAKRARVVDPGPDASGNYDVSPYQIAHGHQVEVAPKDLGKELPKDSQFPRRITTQRMIDRYKAQGLLTKRQWRAGDRLHRIWRDTGRDPSLTASYSPDQVRGNIDPDARAIGRTEAVADWEDCRRLCGGLGFGVLVDVVIWDKAAGEWARSKGHSIRDSGAIGMAFLTGGLDVLAAHFRY